MRHIIIFSGGLDSTIGLLYVLENFAKFNNKQVFDVYSFYYNQTHAIELIAAKNIVNELSKRFNVELNHSIVDLSNIISSIRKDIGEMPYYALRNMILITLATALGIAKNHYIGITNFVYIFTHKSDTESGFADSTKEFFDDLRKALKHYENFAINLDNDIRIPYDRIELITPFIDKYKRELVAEYAAKYQDILEMSWSCYNPIVEQQDEKYYYKPCNTCLACRSRLSVTGEQIKQKTIVLETDVNSYLKQLLNI